MDFNDQSKVTKVHNFRFAKHLSWLFIGVFILAIGGFYNSYFKNFPFIDAKISIAVHLHAVFMMMWLVMLVLQPLFIARGNRKLHKLVGKYSWVFAVLILLSTAYLIVERYIETDKAGVPLITNVAIRLVSIITMFSFFTFYCLAIKHKTSIDVHTRYFIGTALTVIPASATRLLYFLDVNSVLAEFSALIFINLLVIFLIHRDKRKGVKIKEKPYHIILGFQLFLAFYYCFLLGVTLK